MPTSQSIAYIGLGSNISPREKYLSSAIKALTTNNTIELINYSSVYESAPSGGAATGNFLNIVAEIRTFLSAKELFLFLKTLEVDLGRINRGRWSDREIDLDILLFGKDCYSDDDLEIPHPRICERDFVLVPLLEINPLLSSPIDQTAYITKLENLAEKTIIRKLDKIFLDN